MKDKKRTRKNDVCERLHLPELNCYISSFNQYPHSVPPPPPCFPSTVSPSLSSFTALSTLIFPPLSLSIHLPLPFVCLSSQNQKIEKFTRHLLISGRDNCSLFILHFSSDSFIPRSAISCRLSSSSPSPSSSHLHCYSLSSPSLFPCLTDSI